jgi:hypothetical protein
VAKGLGDANPTPLIVLKRLVPKPDPISVVAPIATIWAASLWGTLAMIVAHKKNMDTRLRRVLDIFTLIVLGAIAEGKGGLRIG